MSPLYYTTDIMIKNEKSLNFNRSTEKKEDGGWWGYGLLQVAKEKVYLY